MDLSHHLLIIANNKAFVFPMRFPAIRSNEGASARPLRLVLELARTRTCFQFRSCLTLGSIQSIQIHSVRRPSSLYLLVWAAAIVAYAYTKMDGGTATSSSHHSNPLMDLAKHLKPRLRALLSHYDHDKSTTTAAAAAPSSHRHRRQGRLTAWVLPLTLLAAVALLLNLFASSRTGGLQAVGGARSAVLLPSRAVKQVVYDCGTLGSGGGCAASRLLVLQTSDGRGGYARMLDAMQGVQLAYAQQWGFSYLRWGRLICTDVGG